MAVLVDSLVTGANADHRVVLVVQHLSGGKLGKDIDARLFALLAEPFADLAQTDNVLALVLERRWCDRCDKSFLFSQIPRRVLGHHRIHRTALGNKIRHQFPDRLRVHHAAGQYVGTDERPFLDNADLEVADLSGLLKAFLDQLVVPFDLGLKVQSRRKVRRSGPDKDHIHRYLFAFVHK